MAADGTPSTKTVTFTFTKKAKQNSFRPISTTGNHVTATGRVNVRKGPGVEYDDNRVFAYFGRCVLEKQDIVLKTKGETERDYLYTADAVTAILTVLLDGEKGTAYNAADESTYCSIAEMAEMLAGEAGISVRYDLGGNSSDGYLSTLYMDLDTSRLRALGWNVIYPEGLSEIYRRMMLCMTKKQDHGSV